MARRMVPFVSRMLMRWALIWSKSTIFGERKAAKMSTAKSSDERMAYAFRMRTSLRSFSSMVDLRRGLGRWRQGGRERGWRVLSGTAEAGGLCPDKYMA